MPNRRKAPKRATKARRRADASPVGRPSMDLSLADGGLAYMSLYANVTLSIAAKIMAAIAEENENA
jgi:hypothetical protein